MALRVVKAEVGGVEECEEGSLGVAKANGAPRGAEAGALHLQALGPRDALGHPPLRL